MNELYAGIYKHYKGGLYMVLGAATHSETNEKLVAYLSLSGRAGTKIKLRPYDMFFEQVTVKGIEKPRFVFIGQEVSEVFARFYDPLGGYTGADRDDG